MRVADFGLALEQGAAFATDGSGAPGLLSSDGSSVASFAHGGTLAGTPRYMSPEQLVKGSVDASADQFAFCVSLWEALYGGPPFESDDLLDLYRAILDGRVTEPRGRGVPGWLRQVVQRGLAGASKDRYPSMTPLLDALEADPAVARRRWVLGAGAVAVSVAGLLGFRASESRRAPLCPSSERRLAGVWDDARRAAVRAAFEATAKPYAADAFHGASQALDTYSSAWVAMHNDACEASGAFGASSRASSWDLRMQCLDERLLDLRALADEFVSADPPTVLGALRATDGLPPLSLCANVAALRAPIASPRDPAAAARGSRRCGFRSLMRARSSRPRTCRKRAPSPNEPSLRPRRRSYPPIEAAALEVQGLLLDATGDQKEASAVLSDAVLAAVEGRDESEWRRERGSISHTPPPATSAPTRMVATRPSTQKALLGRKSRRGDRFAEVLTYEAQVAEDESKLEEARALLEQALAIFEKRLSPDDRRIASTESELGGVLHARPLRPKRSTSNSAPWRSGCERSARRTRRSLLRTTTSPTS